MGTWNEKNKCEIMNNFRIIALVAGMVSLSMSGQVTEVRDTLKVIDDAATVVVTSDGKQTKVVVKSSRDNADCLYEFETSSESGEGDISGGWNIDLPFERQKRRSKDEVMLFNGMYGGVIVPMDAPDGMLASWEFGVPYVLGYSYQTARFAPRFSTGLGMASRWFNVGDGYGLGKEGDSLVLTRLPESVGHPGSRFTTSSILVSFGITQRIVGDFAISLNAMLDFNVYTDGFFKSYEGGKDGVRTKISYKGLHQRVFRCDLMASIGFLDGPALYVRYAPTSMFKAGYGPQFKELSAGLQLCF